VVPYRGRKGIDEEPTSRARRNPIYSSLSDGKEEKRAGASTDQLSDLKNAVEKSLSLLPSIRVTKVAEGTKENPQPPQPVC